MRPSEQITIQVKTKDNSDFGRDNPKWETICKRAHAEIAGSRGDKPPKAGRLIQSGDQMVAVNDEDITIFYDEPTHRAWQGKRALRIADSLGDVYGVKSLAVVKGRVWRIKMGVVRS